MIRTLFILLLSVLVYTGCGGGSAGRNGGGGDSGTPPKESKALNTFTIYTKNADENVTAQINNFDLAIQRGGTLLYDSRTQSDGYTLIVNADGSITIGSQEPLHIGDVLSLRAEGFTPQQRVLDNAALEAGSLRLSLKPIGSRQVFALSDIESGHITARAAMGASTRTKGRKTLFKTDDGSVELDLHTDTIGKLARTIGQKTRAQGDTKIYLDITTIDPKTEPEHAIGDFTYDPSKEPRGSKFARSVSTQETMLESVVMASISMSTSDGQEIHCFDASAYDDATGECAGNATATLKIKIPASQQEKYARKYNKGERTVPLYHYSDSRATWVRETRNGKAVDAELVLEDLNANGIADKGETLYLSGEVSHFSTWNGDYPVDRISLSGSVDLLPGAKLPEGTLVVSRGADYAGRIFRVPVGSNLTYTGLGAKSNAKVELYLEYPDGTKSRSIYIQTGASDQEVDKHLQCSYQVERVTLTVEDQDGHPLKGAVVQGAGISAATDAQGHVTAEISKEGSSKITASYDTGSFVSSSTKFVSTQDATIILDTRSFTLRGTVTFTDENGDPISFRDGYVTVSDPQGNFYKYAPIDAGGYTLSVPYSSVHANEDLIIHAGIFVPLYAKYIEEEHKVSIASADMQKRAKQDNFTFTLKPFIVTGKVRNPFAPKGEDGIAGITVYTDSQSVQTDENGNYRMVLFYKKGGQRLRAYDPINGDVVRPDVITIDEEAQNEDHKDENFIIDRRTADIEGSVVNERGVPVQGVVVYTGYGWKSAITDANGVFHFEISDRSLIGLSDIPLYVYDADDPTKRIGSATVSGTLKRGETLEAGEILVTTDIAPIIRSVRWDEPILGQPMNIYVDAYDPDNNTLKTTLLYNGSSIPVERGVVSITPEQAGRLSFVTQVEEQDGDRLTTRSRQSLIVHTNARPVVHAIDGLIKAYDKQSPMHLTISATDPEGASLHYRAKLYDQYGNAQDEYVTVEENNITISNTLPDGTYKLDLRIDDGVNTIGRTLYFSADSNHAPVGLKIQHGETEVGDTLYAKTSDAPIVLRASASDPDGDPLTYEWSVNSALGSVDGDTLTIDPSAKVGVFPISVSVTDGKEYLSKKCTLVIENNLKPVIESVTLNPSTLIYAGGKILDSQGQEVTTLQATVAAYDPEGTQPSYQFGEITSTLSPSGYSADATHTFDISKLKPGRYAFKVDVRDEDGMVKSRRVLFEIKENRPPSIRSFYVPIKAKSGETISLRAVASDPEGKQVTYSWKATAQNGSITVQNAQQADASLQIPQQASGEIEITLTVSDGQNSVSRRRTVKIVENHAPIINQFHISTTQAKVGTSIAFDAMASDPEYDPLTYAWYWNDQKIADSESGTYEIPQDMPAGAYTLKLVVGDGKLTAKQSEKVTVEPLAAKPIVTLHAAKEIALPGEEVEVTAEVSIASRLKWSVSEGGEITPKTGGATFSAAEAGTYTVNVVATNEDGIQSDPASIQLTVAAVTLSLTSPETTQPVGSEFTIDAALSDGNFSIPADAQWEVTRRPDDSNASLEVDGSSVRITPDVAGSYTIKLSFEIDGVAFEATKTIVATAHEEIDEAHAVHGTVTDDTGEVLSGAHVRLYNADDPSLYDQTITTDENGGYLFTEVPAGRYYLVVSGGADYINQTQVVVIN